MNGNVHPNPGPIFPCSVCAGNVTRRGKLVQYCTCSKWVHLRCSLLSLSKFRTLGSSHSSSCPLCCVPAFNTLTSSTVIATVTPYCNTMTSPSDSSDQYTLTVLSGTPSTNAALLLHPRLQTSYPRFANSCYLTTASCCWLFFYASSFSLLTL